MQIVIFPLHSATKKWISQYYIYLIILIGFIFLFTSCQQDDLCLEPQALALRGGFYKKDTANKNVDTLLVNANLRFGADYRYFTNYKKASKFGFTLSPISDTIPVIFQSDSTTSSENTIDTFQIIYTRKLNFVSVGCGYQTFYTLKKIISSNHVIDSVLITVPEITTDINKEHLKIIVKN